MQNAIGIQNLQAAQQGRGLEFLRRLRANGVAAYNLPMFDLIGILGPTCFLLPKSVHSPMPWLDSTMDLRKDPLKILPWARSFLTVGLVYANKIDEALKRHKCYLRIADYAILRDYHKVLRNKIRHLVGFVKEGLDGILENRPPTQNPTTKNPTSTSKFHLKYKIFVDSFPISEKGLAIATFGGTIGKNQLYHSALGSKILLAGVALNLPVATLQKILNKRTLVAFTYKHKNHPANPVAVAHSICYSCNLCVQACPTQALVPVTVQPKPQSRAKNTTSAKPVPSRLVHFKHARCISYLTIENPRPIPHYLQRQMKNWLFGCDDCQDVCPYNKAKQITLTKQELEQRFGKVISPVLYTRKAARFSYHGFKKYFKGTPVLRQKYAVFKDRVGWYTKSRCALPAP